MPALVFTLLLSLLGPIKPGEHPVGYEVSGDVSIWYPATAGGTAMEYRDYWTADTERAAFSTFLREQKISENVIDQFLGAPMLARRNAAPAGGRYPIVFIVQGNGQTVVDQAVLAEIIASHGYVVGTIPSVMIRTSPMRSDDEIGRKIRLEAKDIDRAMITIRRRPEADGKRVFILGHSFGARSALFYSMHNRVRGVISLDGGIGTMKGAGSMNSLGVVPPLLHIYQDIDRRIVPDFRFLQSLRTKSLRFERVAGMRHHHFSTIGFASAAFPEVAAATGAGAELPAAIPAVVDHVLTFLRTNG